MGDIDNWEDLLGGDDDNEPQQDFDEEPDEVDLPDPELESLPEKYRNLTDKKEMMQAILELHKQLAAAPKPGGEKKQKKKAEEPEPLPEDPDLTPEELESLRIARKKEMESRELADVADMYGDEDQKRISIDDFQPATKDDFIKFREALVEKIGYFDRSPHFKNEYFIDELFQGLLKDINSKRIRSIATNLRKFAEGKDKKAK
ncbi:hypothetical protein PTSG_11486, partial [Salpingoeca rosetta]